MSKFELPSTWHGGPDQGDLLVESYSDRFSAHWGSQIEPVYFFDACDWLEVSDQSDIVAEVEDGSFEGTLEDYFHSELDNLIFIVIYASNFSMSWELAPDSDFHAEIGITSDEPLPDMFFELYDFLEDDRLEEDSKTEIKELLFQNDN